MQQSFVIAVSTILLSASLACAANPYQESGTIGSSNETRLPGLTAFCLDAEDHILACDGAGKSLLKIAADDKLLARWELPFAPEAVACDANSILVAGGTTISLLDTAGNVTTRGTVPAAGRRAKCANAALTADYCFVSAYGARGFSVYRFDRDLKTAKEIVSGLRGCCGIMGIATDGKQLYIAENARHTVHVHDLDGNRIRSFGERGKTPDTFAGCCEPKYVAIAPDGYILTASSCNNTVKRFSPKGTFAGICGTTGTKGGCVRVNVAVTQDQNRIYMIDDSKKLIRVLTKP